jgi:uncharacterized membrane-anchored protein
VIVRTAATNFADYFSVDLRLAKISVITALAILLALALWLSWRLLWSGMKETDEPRLLRADLAYWFCMFVAGTLGTVLGDYCSHDWHLGFGWASLILSTALLGFFAIGRNWLSYSLPFYWVTVVMIRAAGTTVGDLFAHSALGLALSTLLTGLLFVGLLVVWKESSNEPLAKQSAL